MRFLVDENVGPSVALWLSTSGHNTASVHLEMSGMSDREIIRKASQEDRILITCDKDFGDLVFRELRSHVGIVLLRLEDYRPKTIIHVLGKFLDEHASQIGGRFVVVTEDQTRFAGPA